MTGLITIKKCDKQVKIPMTIGIKILLLGLAILILSYYSGIEIINSTLSISILIVIIVFGSSLCIHSFLKDRKIKGSYVEFKDVGFSFKSRLKEYQIYDLNKVSSINIRPNTIEILTTDIGLIKIYLNDYCDHMDQKAIKIGFNILKREIANEGKKDKHNY